jgi:hypothetical protein
MKDKALIAGLIAAGIVLIEVILRLFTNLL